VHNEYDLSIITVNYNGLADTCSLISTVPFDRIRLEMIVVDNGSANDEASLISERYPQVRVIRSEENLGFAGGNNLGIRAARGRYVFLVNNDALLPPSADGLKALMARLDASPQTAMVSPKIRFELWPGKPIQYAGYTPLSRITVRNKSIGYGAADDGSYDQPHPTPYCHGAAVMIRREAIEKVGEMPECYFLYYEELDWSMMFTRSGYAIWYDPALTVWHKESRSTGEHSPLKTYYLTRNRLLLVRRNWPPAYRPLAYSYLLLIADTAAVLKHLFTGHFKHAWATMKGIKDFLT